MDIHVFYKNNKGRRKYYPLDEAVAKQLEIEGALLQINDGLYFKVFPTPTHLREFVLYRDKNVCYYCGRHADDISRLTSKADGGFRTPANTIAVCKSCKYPVSERGPEKSAAFDVVWMDESNIVPEANLVYCDASYDPATGLIGLCAVVADPILKIYVKVDYGKNSYDGEIAALQMGIQLAKSKALVYTDVISMRNGAMGKIIKSNSHLRFAFFNDKTNIYYHTAHVYSRWCIRQIKEKGAYFV